MASVFRIQSRARTPLIEALCSMHADEALGMRELHNLIRPELEQVGLDWFHEMLPRHFAAGARQIYGYTPRGRGYSIMKNRLRSAPNASRADGGGPGTSTPPLPDLVFSGTLRDKVTREPGKIRATSTQARQQVRVPLFITLGAKYARSVNIPREIKATTGAEKHELAQRLHDRVLGKLQIRAIAAVAA
jgi:hypothetical protein